ncbi:hypothetical protein SAMN05421749_103298 [Acinetobacter marinus]|uniref:Uncharacterized protein n=1 Tax=Acinetobacter marinus TaxID=281375 RepID=A0A1G6JBY4_9GAMM|nr:hypothetical protein [Acinetobacter marinus]SDC15905.1 hypothetical protein SAMN05421749_103298 [Acinetobacter marinus]
MHILALFGGEAMTEARGAFEKWYVVHFAEKFVNIGAQLEKRGDQYVDFHAQDMWEVWQEQQKWIDAIKQEVRIFSQFIKRFNKNTDKAIIVATMDGFIEGLEKALRGEA